MKRELQLKDIPKGSKIRVEVDGKKVLATFHYLDGMYSYCTIEKDQGVGEGIVHLHFSEPMVLVDGAYELAP